MFLAKNIDRWNMVETRVWLNTNYSSEKVLLLKRLQDVRVFCRKGTQSEEESNGALFCIYFAVFMCYTPHTRNSVLVGQGHIFLHRLKSKAANQVQVVVKVNYL